MPNNSIPKIMMQDIHLSDEELWQQFRTYCQQNNYTSAQAIVNSNPRLQKRMVSAANINLLTGNILSMENLYNANPFDKDRIPVDETEPTGQTAGQVWFQVIE